MATVGIQAGFVEEAPSQTGEGRLWEREGQEQRQGVRGVAPGERKGRVLGGVSFLVPGCSLHSLLVIFKLFLIPAEVPRTHCRENPMTEMHLGRGCFGGVAPHNQLQ